VNRLEFGLALLAELHLPDTQENRVALVAWMAGENTKAKNNPLATTMGAKADGVTKFNDVGVRNYPSAAVGVDATVRTLRLDHYAGVRLALQNGHDAELVLRRVAASPWGTGFAGLHALPAVRANFDRYANTGAGGQAGPAPKAPAPAPPQPPAPPAPAPVPSSPSAARNVPIGNDADRPTLRRGDAGGDVTALQRALAGAGNDPGPADGKFGPRTEKAVRTFQSRFKLTRDGVVGRQTWAALRAGGWVK
jgi:hypothetical protein